MERQLRVIKLDTDDKGLGDVLIEGDFNFWRQFFWNKSAEYKVSPKNSSNNNQPDLPQPALPNLDDMTDFQIAQMLDSDSLVELENNTLKIVDSGYVSEEQQFKNEIENLYYGLENIDDTLWNIMPNRLILSIRHSNAQVSKGEISPTFGTLETIAVSISK